MDLVLSGIAIGVSIIALVVSVFQFAKNIYNSTISVARSEWLTEVRASIYDLLKNVCTDEIDKNKLKLSQYKIELLLSPSESNMEHTSYLEQLRTFADEKNKDAGTIENFVQDSRRFLFGCWIRVKVEGGATLKKDKKLENLTRKFIDERTEYIKRLTKTD